MKKTILLILILIPLKSMLLLAQNQPVLVPDLQGKYTGKVKNGLANGKGMAVGTDTYSGTFKKGYPSGKGIYTWANGDFYKGKFLKGKMDGEGVLTIKINNKDSVFAGIFENGKYIGPKPKPDIKIIRTYNCSGVVANKTGSTLNNTYIYITRDARPAPYQSLSVNINSGKYQETDSYILIENYILPLKISLRYSLSGYMSGAKDVNVEFLIQNPGQYRVDVKNN